MTKFRVCGDICHPGFVVIEAENEAALIDMLTKSDETHGAIGNSVDTYVGEFEIDDEQNKPLAFIWNGDEIEPVA